MFDTKLPESSNVLRAKCIVAGESTVGKTALTQVFLSDGTLFPKNYSMTCGVDLHVKNVNIPDTNDVVEFYLYDSAGKELYSDILLKYWAQPSTVCLVYDVTNENSLNQCKKWHDLIGKLTTDKVVPGVLIANKVDLKERRVITPKNGIEMAKSMNYPYFECSAKENQGIEEPFYYLASEWHKMYLDRTGSFKTVT